MTLLMFRIIGHPAIANDSWIKVGKGLNVLKTFDAEQAKSLFKMLQTINPLHDSQKSDPFADLPLYTSINKETRRIIPVKKTAVIAIFAAPVQLIKKLAAIDPALFETDRIECGRRRDQSLWLNFVELSSSTRWSEIESSLRGLLSSMGPDAVLVVERLQRTMATLQGSDRIKGKLAVELRNQLEAFQQFLPENEQARLDQCLYAVDRSQHFRQAKDVVANNLPIFLTITGSMLGYPGQKADGTPAMATSTTLFDFLVKYLEIRGHADENSLKQHLHQININLQAIGPGSVPIFREEGSSIILEGSQGGAILPFMEMPPVRRIEMLLSALAATYKSLFDRYPKFLLDIGEVKLVSEEVLDLYNFFIRHFSQWQTLVIADSSFLALCADILSDNKDDKDLPVSILDLTEVV